MDLSNVAQLVVPQTQPLEHRKHIQGPDKDTEFLSLRLLNKRARVRLSPARIDYSGLPGKISLLAVGNKKGWLAAAIRKEDNTHHILVSTLSDLRAAFESGQADPEPFIPLAPRRLPFNVPGTPIILKFALNDERLIIGFLEGPILVYDTSDFFSQSVNQDTIPNPIFTFPGDASTIPRDILPNPGESPELVVIMRGVQGQEPGHQIDVVDVQTFKHVASWRKGHDPRAVPVSMSWSPKGKQIAIGLQSGDILLYSPSSAASPKSHLLKPPSVPDEISSLLSTIWLSNPTFHTIYSTSEASSTLFNPDVFEPPPQMHFISTHDTKASSAQDIELRDPCPPFGAKRPPGFFSVVLRNWNPTKFIIFCGGGASSDIGVIGTLPSDDSSRTEGQWVNFTLEETSTPSLPLDEDLNDVAVLGLEIDLTSSTPVRMSEQPDDGTPDLPPSPILYVYASDGTILAWHVLNKNGEAYPGMVAARGADVIPTALTVQGNVKPSMQPLTAPQEASSLFGQISPTSAPMPTQSAFREPSASSGSVAPAQGFGAFAPSSKFGSTGFGFGAGSTPSTFAQAATAPLFGSSSFGGGSGSAVDDRNIPASSGFGSSGIAQKPISTPTFGTTGFGQSSTAPAFGASAFGSKPAAPAFGQSGFGVLPPKPTQVTSAFGSASGGGFAAFAKQGTSAFGAPMDPAAAASKLQPAPSAGFGAFGQAQSSSPGSAFGGNQPRESAPASAFGGGGVGQAPKVTSPPPASAFGSFGQNNSTSAFGRPAPSSAMPVSANEPGAFSGFGTLGDVLKPSLSPARFGTPPGSPPSPTGSLPESPELRPISTPVKATSSYLRPAEGFGALNEPSQGAGAFGAGDKSTIPVVKQAEAFGASFVQKPTAPALGQETAVTSTATSTPTFGAPSMLGQTKPVFGTSSLGSGSQKAAIEPSKPISGGFGAFSSSGGGFASFANAGKPSSFADILSSGEPAKPKPESTPLAFGGTPASETAASPVDQSAREGSSTPTGSKVASVPSAPGTTTESDKSASDKEDSNERFPEEKLTSKEPSASLVLEDDASFSLLSLGKDSTSESETSSQEEGEIHDVEKAEENDEGRSQEEDETTSEPFTITDHSSDESALEATEQVPSPTSSVSGDEETSETHPPESSVTPVSKHPELPPHGPKSPDVKAVSPPPESARPASSISKASSMLHDKPEKPAVTALPSPVSPTPVVPASPFGLGRPTSKPLRSSPLASAPVTSGDGDESAPEVPSPKSTSPATKASPQLRTPLVQRPSPIPASSSAPPGAFADTSPLIAPMGGPSTQASVVQGQSRASPTGLKPSTSLPIHVPDTQPATSSPVEKKEEVDNKHPLQVEFLRAYQDMTNELAQVYRKAQEMAVILPVISESRGLDKLVQNHQDFVPAQYSHGDLKAFTAMIDGLKEKVVPLLELGISNKSSLRDLQNLVLISETKQEEIGRWEHARKDPDFANTLKHRTLGPEHSENQLRLRKAVQVTRDRVQQGEDQMEDLKKRLEQHKSGKFGFRPPSLDTIDRTCRNIQLALEERIKLLEQLQTRIEALSPKDLKRLQASQAQPSVSDPTNVTPPFASVAAAALNSERSSLMLKAALLSARKEPLLTTSVTKLEKHPVERDTRPLLSQLQQPEWKLPRVPPTDLFPGPQHALPISRRSGRGGRRHGAVQLKEGIPESGAATAVPFDWGPLPGAAPMDKLSADVRSPTRS